MFNPFRVLKGLWPTSGSGADSDLSAPPIQTPPTTGSSAAPAASIPTNVTPGSAASVNYPALPKLTAQPAAVPALGSAARSQNPPPVHTLDIDMPDMNLSTTMPQGGGIPPFSTEKADHPAATTIEDNHKNHNTEETHNDIATPTPGSDRPKLQPKRQKERHRKLPVPKPKRDFVSEIVYEVASEDNPLPEGYLGTFRSTRWFTPDYNACLPCGLNGEHRLICGHWVKSEEPCGANCKSEKFDQAPFNCPQCHETVQHVLQNQLTEVEKARLHGLKGKDDVLLAGCCVEYVTKCAPGLKANITETVFSVLRTSYGRACEASEGPTPVEVPPFEQTIRELQESQERKEREKVARENSLNKHAKRKDANNDDANVHSATQVPGTTQAQRDTVTPAQITPPTNKKLKKKLETHREPITPQTRGSKRPLSRAEVASHSSSNKKRKTKLEMHREPITPQSRGTKRSLASSSSSFSWPFHQVKRIALGAFITQHLEQGV